MSTTQPIGAKVSVLFYHHNEVVENLYISFGEFATDESDTDTFGVPEHEIFFQCSLDEMLSSWSRTQDWEIVSLDGFTYEYEPQKQKGRFLTLLSTMRIAWQHSMSR